MRMYFDNQAVMGIASIPLFHEMKKHKN